MRTAVFWQVGQRGPFVPGPASVTVVSRGPGYARKPKNSSIFADFVMHQEHGNAFKQPAKCSYSLLSLQMHRFERLARAAVAVADATLIDGHE